MTKGERAERAADAKRLRDLADVMDAKAKDARELRWEAMRLATKYGHEIPYADEAVEHECAYERTLKTQAKEMRLIAFAIEKGDGEK